jgi:hypothetical protein
VGIESGEAAFFSCQPSIHFVITSPNLFTVTSMQICLAELLLDSACMLLWELCQTDLNMVLREREA